MIDSFQTLDSALVALLPDIYSIENTMNWASLQDLATWYGHYLQWQAVQKIPLPTEVGITCKDSPSGAMTKGSLSVQALNNTSVTPK